MFVTQCGKNAYVTLAPCAGCSSDVRNRVPTRVAASKGLRVLERTRQDPARPFVPGAGPQWHVRLRKTKAAGRAVFLGASDARVVLRLRKDGSIDAQTRGLRCERESWPALGSDVAFSCTPELQHDAKEVHRVRFAPIKPTNEGDVSRTTCAALAKRAIRK